jgi:hypothetical protein
MHINVCDGNVHEAFASYLEAHESNVQVDFVEVDFTDALLIG